jgi:hypothetical protein
LPKGKPTTELTKQAERLHALLASIRYTATVLPLAMAITGLLFVLRGVMFAWRPLAAIAYCGGMAAVVQCDVLQPLVCSAACLPGAWYPWAFYDLPDIASGLVVIFFAVPWGSVVQGRRLQGSVAASSSTIGSNAVQITFATRAANCGAAAEQRMMAAATLAAMDMFPRGLNNFKGQGSPGPVQAAARHLTALILWVGLPAMTDTAVMAQVKSHASDTSAGKSTSGDGDTVSVGAWDRSALNSN